MILKRFLALALVLCVGLPLFAQTSLPLDPRVRKGTLPNGLTYYVMHNEKPQGRAELRLVVNAGSILEDEKQLGLAHFVEHMAFNGTKNFEKNELVNYLERAGTKFGAHLNAYTSFDETVYMLQLPTDRGGMLDTGIRILEDWAHNVTFDEKEIDKERGVVIEEWRLGLGAQERMRTKTFPVLFKDARYADRLPIGKKEILESFNYETLRQFYRDWYRPDLMAVIAVGDFDVDQVEKMIKERFSKLKNPTSVRPRQRYDVPGHTEPLVITAKDKETPYTVVQIYHKHRPRTYTTQADYKELLLSQLYGSMLQARLEELKKQPNPPFLFASSGYSQLVRSADAYASFAVVGENGILEGIKTLVREDERVLQYGFTPSELERAKKEMLTQFESSYRERDKSESRNYASGLVQNFLVGWPMTSEEFDLQTYQAMMPAISVEEVNALAKKWITDENTVVIVGAPDKPGMNMPSEGDILGAIKDARNSQLTPYEDEAVSENLMDAAPAAGSVASTSKMNNLGITMVTLSNGVKVYLKPTDFKNDEVRLQAFSKGGTSLYNDDVFNSADMAASIIDEMGVGNHSLTQLEKMLAGKKVSVSPYISGESEGISASASPNDMETMMQLVYLYFTAPHQDENAFQSFIQQQKMFQQNLASSPETYFFQEVNNTLMNNHPRAKFLWSQEDFNKVKMDEALRIYKDRFADANDFTFVMVGNFDVEKIKPLLSTYIASLPVKDGSEKPRDVGLNYVKGNVEKVVRKGVEPKSMVSLIWTGAVKDNAETRHQMQSMLDVLRIRLREAMREDKGGVYGVQVAGSTDNFPSPTYRINVSFGCSPDNVDSLIAIVHREIAYIQKNGAGDENLQKVKETQRRSYETDLKENRWWMSNIISRLSRNESLDDILQENVMTESLTGKSIKKAAKKLFSTKNYVQMVMRPENEK